MTLLPRPLSGAIFYHTHVGEGSDLITRVVDPRDIYEVRGIPMFDLLRLLYCTTTSSSLLIAREAVLWALMSMCKDALERRQGMKVHGARCTEPTSLLREDDWEVPWHVARTAQTGREDPLIGR